MENPEKVQDSYLRYPRTLDPELEGISLYLSSAILAALDSRVVLQLLHFTDF